MTKQDIQYRMRTIENKAAALGVALYDLIEEMQTYSDKKGAAWRASPKGGVYMNNLDRLEQWHEAALEIGADHLVWE
jgi:hypothetical protein